MLNKDFENRYIVQEKHGAFDYFYLWEKEMWNELFKGKLNFTDAINIARKNSIPFFAMPESKRKSTFLDTYKINTALGIETIDQKSLFVNAKESGRNKPFSWNANTPDHLIESKKLLNRGLGFEPKYDSSKEKIYFDTWYKKLV